MYISNDVQKNKCMCNNNMVNIRREKKEEKKEDSRKCYIGIRINKKPSTRNEKNVFIF